MAKVVLENLTKRFGKQTVVDNVSLEVGDGEFVALFGLPGAGKTTILRMIAGLETVTEGKIWIGDQVVNDFTPAERDIAMVFQSFALYPTKSVYDNLAFPLKKRSMSKEEIDNRVKEIADLLGISHLLDKRPATLSGGEKQRVALGRAIVRKPRVFLLDEPLTNLDAKLRLHMRAELKKLQKDLGQTAIFSTPDELEAISMADKIAVLNLGKLVQYDDVDTVYDHPNSLFVARNIGSPPMNVLEGVLEEKDKKLLLNLGFYTLDITEYRESINAPSGTSLLLGIRPSEITLSKEAVKKDSIKAHVEITEPTGSETIVTLNLDGNMVITTVPQAFILDRGETIWLTFNKKTIHIFDKATGKAFI